MKDLRRMYIRLLGEPNGFQTMIERALTLRSGVAKVTDVLYPADNSLVEEAFKKYTYKKPAPAYPECPYSVAYPHRTRKFSLNLQAKANLRRAITGAVSVSRLVGRSRQGRPEEGMPLGAFGMFL
jgi:hypothetical protein